MSLYILATGTLTADPVARTGAKGIFVTASLRTEDGAILISLIAFGDTADTVLEHRQGAALAVSGRARLTSWAGHDGAEKHGLSVVAEQIASAGAAHRADAQRRQERRAA